MNPDPDITKNSLKKAAIEHVQKSGVKITPVDLERKISAEFRTTARTARKLIKSLVAENRLTYTQQLGRTFVEISRNRPVHVGGGVILAPPDIAFTPEPGQILVRIAPGASFGTGDHPTTRIALQLISKTFRKQTLPCTPENAKVLDIGTGTGVLAIAACLMGAKQAIGIDTDPCARSEAIHNIRLNGLQDRITVDTTQRFEKSKHKAKISPDKKTFSLVLANLRYPTLARLHADIAQITTPGGLLIFSGFRPHETPGLKEVYTTHGFRHTDTLTENHWCGIIFRKIQLF